MILNEETVDIATIDAEINKSLESFKKWKEARPPRQSVSREEFATAIESVPAETLELIARYIDRMVGVIF